VLKVLSWFRSKPALGAEDSPLADSWRLDQGVPAPRQRNTRQEQRQEPRQESRQEQRSKSARTAQKPDRTVQEIRRILEQSNVAEPTLAPAPAPSRARQQAGPRRSVARAGVLAAGNLEKSYGGRKVVNDVSVNVMRGEAVGLLGPNGAGKTTVFYMVIGLVVADAGRINLDGHDVTKLPMYRRARLGIGYLPQEASIFRGLSVEDNIGSVLEIVEPDRHRRREQLESLLDEFDLARVRRSPAIALSGGERRRVEIARALATRPSYMLLDEPFAGIDPIAVGDIQELVRHLKERGIGVLITDHNVRETLGLVDRAYIVHSGTILMEGGPDEIVESREVRRLYLGEDFRL
jgi:lipopolysaccharide export system ATP-binding protein